LTDAEIESISVRDFFILADRWSREERRKDARAALIAWATASAMGAKHASGRDLKVEDFMPGESEETLEQTPEQMQMILDSMVMANGNGR
jgi:hypothetical protein